ncbi:MAG: redox-sensing transcriptional repressor Rex [Eubacteriales bacterium]
MGLGEVQVRKDLGTFCGSGKPKIGYLTEELISSLERFLCSKNGGTVIIGAGKLGRALLDYGVFSDYGLDIMAAFDIKVTEEEKSASGKRILPCTILRFPKNHDVKIGVVVPPESAQEVCNLLYENGVKAMWCFAPCQLYKPADAIIQYENMALSLAHLKMQIK